MNAAFRESVVPFFYQTTPKIPQIFLDSQRNYGRKDRHKQCSTLYNNSTEIGTDYESKHGLPRIQGQDLKRVDIELQH